MAGFKQRLNARFSRTYQQQSMTDWVSENTTIDGKPYSVEGYEFQRAILDDLHPNLCVVKPSQCGISETQIRKALGFAARNSGVSLIFTLPTVELHKRMAQTRVLPLVEHDRVFNLAADESSVRSMGVIQIGRSYVYLTTCTEADATSTAADALFHDEIDISDQKMVSLFQSRMNNSDWKVRQLFSTPTFEKFGISDAYAASDQRQYLQRCPACNKWQLPFFNAESCYFPDLPKHIEDLLELTQDDVNTMDLSKAYVRCVKCSHPLVEPRQEWVAKYQGRVNARGYKISPFNTSKITLANIVQQLLLFKKNDYIRGFHNTTLGETYSDEDSQISLSAIQAAMDRGKPGVPEVGGERPCVLGIDMGQTAHLVLGDANGRDIFLFEAVPIGKLIARVKELFGQYNIVAGCVDRFPYTPTSEELRDWSELKILPVQYDTGKNTHLKLMEDEYGDISHGAINRTKILDEVATSMKNSSMTFCGYGHQKEILTAQLRDMVRKEDPETPASWEKLTGNDHYHHALALYKAAIQFRPLVIEKLQDGVGTAWGISAVPAPMMGRASLGASNRVTVPSIGARPAKKRTLL